MLLFYCGYYLLDFSFGMVWWTTSKLWNGAVYVYKSNYAIEYNTEVREDKDEFVILENDELKRELIELKELIKSTTKELN
jgi:hypothetical protein